MTDRGTSRAEVFEIMVVNDTPASLKLLTDLLVGNGYHVRPATDGMLALRSVAAKHPDLILLDVKMPEMDGFEACRRLKADEKTRHIPVLFLSVLSDTADKTRGFRAGGLDYITFPFQSEEVLARVRTHLTLKELSENLERKVAERTRELDESNRWLREEIDERLAAEERMARALREKETLLREVHHRVKNNLTIVSSLLSLQSRKIADPALFALFEESQQRIRAMAIVHERLYKFEDLSEIRFRDYIQTLIAEIAAMYRGYSRRISTEIEIEDIALTLERAVPCALVINELLTNVFKHAFPGERKGTVRIRFLRQDGKYVLSVWDDGIGFAETLWNAAETLGVQLIHLLAEQLGGEAAFSSHQGTRIVVTFPDRLRQE